MRVLREPDFRNLFSGQTGSMIGDEIVVVALALYVTEIGSPTDVGIVLAAATLPLVAFLAVGGVWADRLPRHRVMIATDLIRFALHALLAALIFTGAVEIWHIVVIEALFGTAEAVLPPRLHRARAADRAGGDDPGGAGGREHDRDAVVVPRAGVRDGAGARPRGGPGRSPPTR